MRTNPTKPMQYIYKLNPKDLAKTRSSIFDERIDCFLERYDQDGSNVFALTKEQEGQASNLRTRILDIYAKWLEKRGLTVSTVTLGPKHQEMIDAGYTKLVVLLPTKNETEDDAEDTPEGEPEHQGEEVSHG